MAMMTSLPWCSSGTNGIGGQVMTLAMVDELLGRRLGGGDEAGDHVRASPAGRACRRRSADLVEPELEPGHDAEVAAAATDRPEQVRLVLGVDVQELAVGGDDLGREQESMVRPYLRTR